MVFAGLTFATGGERWVLPLDRVVEVSAMVRIAAMAQLGRGLLGYIVHRGHPVVTVDLGLRAGKASPPPSLDDHLVIARLDDRVVALRVERVLGVESIDAAFEPLEASARPAAGVAATEEGLLFIFDLDDLLSLEERRALDEELVKVGR